MKRGLFRKIIRLPTAGLKVAVGGANEFFVIMTWAVTRSCEASSSSALSSF